LSGIALEVATIDVVEADSTDCFLARLPFLVIPEFLAFKPPESMGLVEKQAGKSLSRLNQC